MNLELMVTNNRPMFSNKQLVKATEQLIAIAQNIRTRQFDIAAILADVEVNNLYKDDGFSSCAEYAETVFGMKKSLAYALIRIGKDYTRPVLNNAGRCIGHASCLVPAANPDKQDAPLVDFTTTQIERMLALPRDTVINLVSEGKLSPSNTVREIIEVVKANKVDLLPATQEQEPEVEAQEQEPEVEAQEQESEVEAQAAKVLLVDETHNVSDIPATTMIKELISRGYEVSKDGYKITLVTEDEVSTLHWTTE